VSHAFALLGLLVAGACGRDESLPAPGNDVGSAGGAGGVSVGAGGEGGDRGQSGVSAGGAGSMSGGGEVGVAGSEDGGLGGDAGERGDGGGAGAAGAGGAASSGCDETPVAAGPVRFAVLGDYGSAGPEEAAVAALVGDFDPDLVLTVGDNNYPDGEAATIDANIGQYFHAFICPYTGGYGAGADRNRFFPTLGNHDWVADGAEPYLDYFELPGNERYYDLVWGDVHFFALDSDPHEPDGIGVDSIQATWLEERLEASTSKWQIVLMHHPPYSSSSRHGSTSEVQWPFAAWGADLVIAGHDHAYERLDVDGIVYVVNGLGGRSIYEFGTPVAGSVVRYNEGYGATFVVTDETRLAADFVATDGSTPDSFEIPAD
jgi:hypothetical protein